MVHSQTETKRFFVEKIESCVLPLKSSFLWSFHDEHSKRNRGCSGDKDQKPPSRIPSPTADLRPRFSVAQPYSQQFRRRTPVATRFLHPSNRTRGHRLRYADGP